MNCFKYYFEHYSFIQNKEKSEMVKMQEFWNCDYSINVDLFDLDDPVWRRLFSIDLSKHPDLQQKVIDKKREIEQIQEELLHLLYMRNIVPKDVIVYCIFPFV